MNKSIVILTISLGLVFSANAQKKLTYEPLPYAKQNIGERHVINWPFLREADVMYMWRTERIIDTREKQNIAMTWPKNPLWFILETAIMKDRSLNVYFSDSLIRKMQPEDINKAINYETVIPVQDDPNDPYAVHDSTVQVVYHWDEIKRYKIMEDWIFDKKLSQFYCRIIGIAPMFQPYAGGMAVPEQPMCWIKYHDNGDGTLDDVGVPYTDTSTFRQLVINQEVYNRFNDASRMSYDDFFEMRMFNSYIVKESNPFDLRIKSFDEFKDDPVSALLESDKIKKMLFEKEHDMWEF